MTPIARPNGTTGSRTNMPAPAPSSGRSSIRCRTGCCAGAAESVARIELQIAVAVDRGHADLAALTVLLDGERYGDAGVAQRPDAAIAIGEVAHLLSRDFEHAVAARQPGFRRRSAAVDPHDDERVAHRSKVEAEPGMMRAAGSPGGQQIG